jgi:hypothetical protein
VTVAKGWRTIGTGVKSDTDWDMGDYKYSV